MSSRRAALVVAASFLTVPAGAWAFPDALGPRVTAMGDAGRADAQATDALRLNPAGMSLTPLYNLTADYQLITKGGGGVLNVAVADSTSDSKIAGGLYYAHKGMSPAGLPALAAHEAGLALAYPFADHICLGATAKYFHVSNGIEPDGRGTHDGFTADVGLALTAGGGVTIGVTGYNLRDLSTVQAPVALGYGVAFAPGTNLAVVLDVLHDFTTSDHTRGIRTTVGGGAELLLKDHVAFRAGGGRDGGTSAAFVSGGLAAVSEIGAIDASLRQDVTGNTKVTAVVVGLRLFIQAPQSSSGDGYGPSSGPSSGTWMRPGSSSSGSSSDSSSGSSSTSEPSASTSPAIH
ncbi:MAG TPA: hypothetical protein VGP07_21255 [Polyangia bacterium]|jgi:hypothetical protein